MSFDFDDIFLKKLKKGDSVTFNKFYLETVDIFFSYIKSYYFFDDEDIKDILGTFYLKLWKNISKFDFDKSFNAYIWTILKNLIKDYIKKSKDVPFSMLNNNDEFDFEKELEDVSDIQDLFNKNFTVEQIKDALALLDGKSKDIVFLKYIEEKTNSEISDILGISVENVRQRLSRALKKLKKKLL